MLRVVLRVYAHWRILRLMLVHLMADFTPVNIFGKDRPVAAAGLIGTQPELSKIVWSLYP
jgi:hypothetical protein